MNEHFKESELLLKPKELIECAGVTVEFYDTSWNIGDLEVAPEQKFILKFLDKPLGFLPDLQEGQESRVILQSIQTENNELYKKLQESAFRGNKLAALSEELWELKSDFPDKYNEQEVNDLSKKVSSVMKTQGKAKLYALMELRNQLIAFLQKNKPQ